MKDEDRNAMLDTQKKFQEENLANDELFEWLIILDKGFRVTLKDF